VGAFVLAGGAEKRVFAERGTEELDADGEAGGGEAAGEGEAGDAGDVAGDGEDIAEIHLEGVVGFGAELEGGGGAGGAGDDIAFFEGLVEILLDFGANLEGLEVELVGVTCGEGVGAEHDAAFYFGAETLAAAGGVKVDEVFGGFGAVAVVDAIVAGEIAGGFGGGNDVIGGDAILGVRERDIDKGCALGFVPLDGGLDRGFDFRVHAFDVEEFLGESDAEALQRGVEIGEIIGGGFGPAGGIAGIVAGDDLKEEGGVFDGEGHGADLIEGGGEGDEAVTGDEAIRWLEADDAAEGSGLADRAAGIGTQTAEAEASGTGGCRAAGGTARDTFGVPWIFGGAEGGVFGGGAHGEFIEVGFSEDDGAGGFEFIDDGGVVGGVEVFEHFGGAGGCAEGGAHVVFDGDGDAGEEAEGLALGAGGIDGGGFFEGTIGEDAIVCMQIGIQAIDGGEGEAGGFDAGEFSGGDFAGDLSGGHGIKVCHSEGFSLEMSGNETAEAMLAALLAGLPDDAAKDPEGGFLLVGVFDDGDRVAGFTLLEIFAGAANEQFAEGRAGGGLAGPFVDDVAVHGVVALAGYFVSGGIGCGDRLLIAGDGDEDQGRIGGSGAAVVDGELIGVAESAFDTGGGGRCGEGPCAGDFDGEDEGFAGAGGIGIDEGDMGRRRGHGNLAVGKGGAFGGGLLRQVALMGAAGQKQSADA